MVRNIGIVVEYPEMLEATLSEARLVREHIGCGVSLVLLERQEMSGRKAAVRLLHDYHLRDAETDVRWPWQFWLTNLPREVAQHNVDLLFLAAHTRQSLVDVVRGNTVGQLLGRTAVFLMPLPDKPLRPVRRLLAVLDQEDDLRLQIEVSCFWARVYGLKEIYVAEELYLPGGRMTLSEYYTLDEQKRVRADLVAQQEADLRSRLDALGETPVKLNPKVTFGVSESGMMPLLTQLEVDMVVNCAPPLRVGVLDNLFSHDFEYLLQDLPCRMFVYQAQNRRLTT